MKNGFIDPESSNDSRVVLNDESGRASITRWSELKLDKPMKGIVVGVRKITLGKCRQAPARSGLCDSY
jgi:hypothetical protein